MIAVILDSNSLYGDPFFSSGNLKRLIAYSSLNKIDVLISDVVEEEVINNNLKKIQINLEKIKGQAKTINEVVGSQAISLNAIDTDIAEKELRKRFNDLSADGSIIKIPYKNDMMPDLINRALKKIRPFKENKEEFRDSVIWLSCIEYLKSKDYESVYFISNNSSDFCGSDGKLHQDLKNDYDGIVLYKNLKAFFSEEKEEISKLIPEGKSVELMAWLAKNEPDGDAIKDMLRDNFFENISANLSQLLSSISVHDIDSEIFDGYVQPYELDDFCLDDYEVNVDIDSIIVTGQCSTSNYVEAYQYNPVYDSSDEKFSFTGEVEVEVTLDFMFSISPEQKEPYDFDITGARSQIV